MALFYLIATSKKGDFEWGQIYSRIDTFRHKYVTVFPISKRIGLLNNAIGITANPKYRTQVNFVIKELTQLLDVLWDVDFEVSDLYMGKTVTKSTIAEVMSYIL
jgi:hypothetical protein